MTHWYIIRAAGAMTLILFTLTTALGLINRSRWATERWPRFVIDRVHRNVALLAVVFLCLHIIMVVTDSFVSTPLLSVLIPFTAGYRPLWTGLGAIAFDLMIAITITSLLRARLGHRTWRAIHWLAYASWPIAVAHGIGSGTDAWTIWMLAIDVCCVTAVLAALVVRLVSVPRLETAAGKLEMMVPTTASSPMSSPKVKVETVR
jgi:methionine sulfoxide reductase heme-binding subunit